jgi:glycosyltransferase involved in cell wall biosynthesis
VPSEPSLCVLYEFRSGPWGGGNQFLKALLGVLDERGASEPDPLRADVLLVNSHHGLARAAGLKRRHPGKSVIHRLAGPLVLSRPGDGYVDRVIRRFNATVASGTVFQSQWARQAWRDAGLEAGGDSDVIPNAPNPAIFHPAGSPEPTSGRRLRLIATSWSSNPRKGFDVYAHLDRSLDRDRYEMTFVGNTPVRFENIRVLEPMPSDSLADELRRHDVYVTASRIEACPNSLLEAMHCGLPALAIRSGAHPELVGEGGELFDDAGEALSKLDLIAERYDEYRAGIRLPSIGEVADRYVELARRAHERRAGRATGRRDVLLAGALDSRLGKRALRAGFALSGRRLP